MTKTHSTRATLSSKLSVLEESFIFKKVFVLVRRSAGLTLKPLGSSPYEKDKSLNYLYLIFCFRKRGYYLLLFGIGLKIQLLLNFNYLYIYLKRINFILIKITSIKYFLRCFYLRYCFEL